MKTAVLLFALCLASAVSPASEIELKVGSVLPAEAVPKENSHLYMTHPAQLRPYIERDVDGVRYVVAYEEKSRVARYIFTDDKKFKAAGGLRVGNYIAVHDEQVIAYPGWEVRGPKGQDGWEPIIGFDSQMTVLDRGKEIKIGLTNYRLPAGRTVQAKIFGFAMGGN